MNQSIMNQSIMNQSELYEEDEEVDEEDEEVDEEDEEVDEEDENLEEVLIDDDMGFARAFDILNMFFSHIHKNKKCYNLQDFDYEKSDDSFTRPLLKLLSIITSDNEKIYAKINFVNKELLSLAELNIYQDEYEEKKEKLLQSIKKTLKEIISFSIYNSFDDILFDPKNLCADFLLNKTVESENPNNQLFLDQYNFTRQCGEMVDGMLDKINFENNNNNLDELKLLCYSIINVHLFYSAIINHMYNSVFFLGWYQNKWKSYSLRIEKKLKEKEEIIAEKEKVIAEKEKIIAEKEKIIEEKQKVIKVLKKPLIQSHEDLRLHEKFLLLSKKSHKLSEEVKKKCYKFSKINKVLKKPLIQSQEDLRLHEKYSLFSPKSHKLSKTVKNKCCEIFENGKRKTIKIFPKKKTKKDQDLNQKDKLSKTVKNKCCEIFENGKIKIFPKKKTNKQSKGRKSLVKAAIVTDDNKKSSKTVVKKNLSKTTKNNKKSLIKREDISKKDNIKNLSSLRKLN